MRGIISFAGTARMIMTSSTNHRSQILLAALLFSTGGAAIKACSLTSWQVASFRSGIATITLLLFSVAYIFMIRGVRGVGALEVSLLLLLEPVLNPIWAWLVHGEQPTGWALIGGAVILTATVVKTWLGSREPEAGTP